MQTTIKKQFKNIPAYCKHNENTAVAVEEYDVDWLKSVMINSLDKSRYNKARKAFSSIFHTHDENNVYYTVFPKQSFNKIMETIHQLYEDKLIDLKTFNQCLEINKHTI